MAGILGLYNLIDTATLSGGTWESTLPRANIQTRLLSQVARTTTDAALTLTIDLASASSVGVVAIANHNFSSAGTVQVEVYNGATLLDDSTDIKPKDGFFCYLLDANVTATQVKITVTNTSNPDTYLELGRVFVGQLFEPANGVDYGDVSHGLIDNSQTNKTPTGIKFFLPQAKARTAAAEFKHLTSAESLVLRAAQRTHGTTEEVVYVFKRPVYSVSGGVLVQDAESFEHQFLGTFSELSALRYPYHAAVSGGVAVEEII